MSRPAVFALLFAVGAFSQAGQAILSREMLVVFHGNEASFGFFYAAWLFWIAAASLLAGRSRMGQPARALVRLCALFPAALAAGVLLLRAAPLFMGVPAGQLIPMSGAAFGCILATLPVAALVGAVFPMACRAMKREEGVSEAYAVDALGGLAGGAVFSLLLAARGDAWHILGLMSALLGLVLLLAGRAFRSGPSWILLGLALWLTPVGDAVARRAGALRWRGILPGLELLESFETPYQNISIATRGGQISVVADGKVTASFPESTTQAVEAALLIAQHPKARRVLLVGAAAGGLVPELLKYPIERVECVEQDERAYRRIRPYLPQAWAQALEDPRVRIHFSDPRLFFNAPPSMEPYDLIAALVPDPSTAQQNRLFTEEFYSRARAMLAEDGVFVTRAASAENYLGKDVRGYGASIFRTLAEVFPDVRATPGDTSYFFASKTDGRLTLDPAVLAKRIKVSRVPPEVFHSLLPKDRVDSLDGALREGDARLNTDLKPVTYYLNMVLWSRFSGSRVWGDVLEAVQEAGAAFFILPMAAFALFSLGSGAGAWTALAGMGFASMTLEIVLLFTFQSLFGSVYQKVGLLNGLFMAGLAAGSFAMARLGAARSARPGRWLLAGAACGAAFAWALPRLLEIRAESGYWLLVTASGALAGSVFPAAVRLYASGAGDIGRTSGALDCADHAGGMLGALLAGTLVVPLLGVEGSCRLASCALVLTCLPVLIRASRPIRWLSWGVAAVLLCVWAISLVPSNRQSLPGAPSPELEAFSGLQRFESRDRPFPHQRAFDSSGRFGGVVVDSLSVDPAAKGYGGPLRLLLAVSESGRILGLKLLESHETPAYAKGLEAFLARFRGLDASGTLRLGRDLDGITGATITSKSVTELVNRSSKRAREELLGFHPRPAAPRPSAKKVHRSVDKSGIEKLIEQGELSSREAMFYSPAEGAP
ncbi:MAG: FMN-binding protein [Elusimicrobiota bacterium]